MEENANQDLNSLWMSIKGSVLTAAEEICGKKKMRQITEKTRWWNNEVTQAVREKKLEWKIIVRTKEPNYWAQYIEK